MNLRKKAKFMYVNSGYNDNVFSVGLVTMYILEIVLIAVFVC